MMTRIAFASMFFGLLACQHNYENIDTIDSELQEMLSEIEEMVEVEEPEFVGDQNLWITPTSVGDLNLGDSVPQEGYFQNFEVKHISFERQAEESSEMETVHKVILLDRGKKVLEIQPSLLNGKPHLIEEFRVVTEKFETERNIWVGTTIEEFFGIYPDAEIWYTYVSDRMVMETPTLPMQFELNKEDYIPEIVIETDMDMKKREDFKPGAAITSIRIF